MQLTFQKLQREKFLNKYNKYIAYSEDYKYQRKIKSKAE